MLQTPQVSTKRAQHYGQLVCASAKMAQACVVSYKAVVDLMQSCLEGQVGLQPSSVPSNYPYTILI